MSYFQINLLFCIRLSNLIWTSGIFLFVQFIRYFLKTFNRFPIWDKALKIIALAHPIVSIAKVFYRTLSSRKMERFIGMVFLFFICRGSFYDFNYILKMHKEFKSIFKSIIGVCHSRFYFLVFWFWTFFFFAVPF